MANETSNSGRKKKIATTGLAVALAAGLVLGGGSYAYLTGTSEEVENTFSENNNGVDLDETTGNEYDIVPGTSQEKDPTVTATYTLDSYVFVEVTDATDDLVTWYIANGWTLLSTTENEDGSTTSVYYMKLETLDTSGWETVTNSDSDYNGQLTYTDENGITYYYDSETETYTAVIPVLEDNTVYYSSTLTNDDLDATESVSLIFQSYIIQAEPFDTAKEAWDTIKYGDGIAYNVEQGILYTESVDDAIDEAEDGDTIILLADNLTVEASDTAIEVNMTLDLNGYTLNVSHILLEGDADLVIQNGTLNATTGIAQDVTSGETYGTGNLTLTDVDLVVSSGTGIQYNTGTVTIDADSSVTANGSTAILVYPSSGDATAVLNVYGTVETTAKTFAISGNGQCSWDNATEINIYDGAWVKSSYPSAAIYHPQNGTLNIYGGTITGYCGIGIANGTLNISGGTIEGTSNDSALASSYGSGGLTYDGSALILAVGYGDFTVNISGGTIQSTYSYGLRSYSFNNYSHTATVNITGGTISGGTGDINVGSYVTATDSRE